MRRRGLALIAVVACAAALALSACGKSSDNGTRTIGVAHAAVGFVFHAGLAFGAFKHFIYTPYQQGQLKLSHPIKLTKAAAAGLFAYHELKLAAADVRDNKHTAKLAGPMLTLGAGLAVIKTALLHGHGSQAVSSANSEISSIQNTSSTLGSPIKAATSGFNF